MIWFRKPKVKAQSAPELATSILYNETTFYNQFVNDLNSAKEEVIIESPFITINRLKTLIPIFKKLKNRNIQILIITRSPLEQDGYMGAQSELGIQWFENMGIQVLIEYGGHHRKLAMIDKRITYEGSLNILSQSQSLEFMRRIESKKLTEELIKFIRYDGFSNYDD
jgi:phosphatidylserine/phosphatidylglycerophosphate/cardiolipin synthase-like enzyme